ncbi:MAG: hypothetical protein WBP64_15980, partial [Nitrososphaeraceae archaeon]
MRLNISDRPCLALLAMIFLVLVFLLSHLVCPAQAASLVFTRHYMKDGIFDWIDVSRRTKSMQGEPATDIVGVSYFSNGQTLNSTIWLLAPFIRQPLQYDTMNYGIMVDSDYDKTTGVGGVDYQLEISWINKTKTWNKALTEWSTSGRDKLVEENRNYTGFYHNGSYYVSLPLDLSTIPYPNKYKVAFYAESEKGGRLTTDFSNWINIPPANLAITTSPNPIVVRQGEQKTVEVRLNTTQGFEPLVHLSVNNVPGLNMTFKYTAIQIPSQGFTSVPLIITASKNISVSPYTLLLSTNSSFPTAEFIGANVLNSGLPGKSLPDFLTPKEEISTSRTVLVVTMQDALSDIDRISDFWNKLGSPISFVY